MIDIHTHVIPNVDDGSSSIEESLKMLRHASENGCHHIICTPHFVHNVYTKSVDEIKEQFESLCKACKEASIDVELYLGQEIMYTHSEKIFSKLENGELLTINGTNNVLVEFSFNHKPEDLEDVIYRFNIHHYHPIVAHVERYKWMTIKDIETMRNMGCSIQINANSILGMNGLRRMFFSKKLLKKGYVDFIASDMHSFRPSNMKKAYKKIKDDKYFKNYDILKSK